MRAEFKCYSDETCGASGGFHVVYESALECCQQGVPSVVRSYTPVNGSDPCQHCNGASKIIAIICMLVLLWCKMGLSAMLCFMPFQIYMPAWIFTAHVLRTVWVNEVIKDSLYNKCLIHSWLFTCHGRNDVQDLTNYDSQHSEHNRI